MLIVSLLISFFQIISPVNHLNAGLHVGVWRGVLTLHNGDLPFNFEVKSDGKGETYLEIINDDERIRVDEITIEDDSVLIRMPVFDSEFRLHFDSQRMSGLFINHARTSDNVFPFKAEYGINYRFTTNGQAPIADLTGRWECDFSKGTADSSKAIGVFRQNGSKLTGTFLTTTGDDRYLEGSVVGDKMMLSCFDGSHLFLFNANILPDGSLQGMYYSGNHWKEPWIAMKNENYQLPDPYSITYLKPDFTKLDFTFPDINGKNVSLSDPQFKNKVVIVQITGSWCPNCMDETAFYAPLYDQYEKKGLEIIALDFERISDRERVKLDLERLKKRFNIHYTILLAGIVGDEANKALPMLNGVKGYPTSIFIDRKGNVRKIYTGINGPATGGAYEKWKDDTVGLIETMLRVK